MTARKRPVWDDYRVDRLLKLWPRSEITTEVIALRLGVSTTALRRFVKKHRNVLKLKRRPAGGIRIPKAATVVYVPPMPAGPVLPPSDIPWPTARQCMGRRA